MKKILSVALICSMLLAFLSGCSYFDYKNEDEGGDIETSNGTNENSSDNNQNQGSGNKKYTGGLESDSHFHAEYGIYWLETYEEVTEAVELLKSHGSTIKRSIGFDCEGDLLDVKWCFLYQWSDAEPLEEGKSFFDRKIDDGEFVWYAFYLDTTIDELLYSYAYDYDCMKIDYGAYRFSRSFANVEDASDLVFNWFGKDRYEGCETPENGKYIIEYKGEEWAYMHSVNEDRVLPQEYFDVFLSTVVIVE